MQRSMQLGHCICDPKKPCPCDVLREHDVCPCAGESMPERTGPVSQSASGSSSLNIVSIGQSKVDSTWARKAVPFPMTRSAPYTT